MWYILSFEMVHKTKGIFWCGIWEASFFPYFQLGLIDFGFYLLLLNSCLTKSAIGNLSHLSSNLSSLDSLCKNTPTNIRMIYEAKTRWVKHIFRDFFIFCRINMYGLECFRCVCHEILSRIDLNLLQSGWYFTGLIIMVHQHCTW